MKRYLNRLLLAATLLAPSATTAVAASCQGADLQGAWRYTSLFNFVVEDPESLQLVTVPFAVSCRLIVNSRRVVTSASCFEGDIGPTFKAFFTGATIGLNSACHINSCREGICHIGQMSKDKVMIAGIVRSEDTRGSFNAIKE